MLKVLAACGAGMGSSQIIKMKVKNVFNKLGIEIQLDHMSVGQAKSSIKNYDIVFVSKALKTDFKDIGNAKIIGLQNVLSEKEIEERLKELGY